MNLLRRLKFWLQLPDQLIQLLVGTVGHRGKFMNLWAKWGHDGYGKFGYYHGD